jgi:hypothetical protein
MATGADLVGNWSFNGNGSAGTMEIFSAIDDGPVTLRVHFDGLAREDPWSGTWSPGRREIILSRILPGGVIQTHTGHLGDNSPPSLIFGGSFTELDAGNLQFGWFAQWSTPIIFVHPDRT